MTIISFNERDNFLELSCPLENKQIYINWFDEKLRNQKIENKVYNIAYTGIDRDGNDTYDQAFMIGCFIDKSVNGREFYDKLRNELIERSNNG